MLRRPVNSAIWLREIIMAIDGQDVVFARSFTPLAAAQGLWRGMRTLQTRPLADMLYNDPAITRSAFFHCRMAHGQPIHAAATLALGAHCPAAQELLARCSVFWRDGAPLLVAESFLPAFWPMAQPQPQEA